MRFHSGRPIVYLGGLADEYGGLIILNYTGLKDERLFLPLMVRK